MQTAARQRWVHGAERCHTRLVDPHLGSILPVLVIPTMRRARCVRQASDCSNVEFDDLEPPFQVWEMQVLGFGHGNGENASFLLVCKQIS
jgi:hypothetical protein